MESITCLMKLVVVEESEKLPSEALCFFLPRTRPPPTCSTAEMGGELASDYHHRLHASAVAVDAADAAR